MEARYQTSCEKADGGALITDFMFQQVATTTFDQLLEVCDKGKLAGYYWYFNVGMLKPCACNIFLQDHSTNLVVSSKFYESYG